MDEEMEKKPRGIRGGIWTEDSGVPVPQEPEGVRKPKKYQSFRTQHTGRESERKVNG